jgi:putative ABC transport system permease protein
MTAGRSPGSRPHRDDASGRSARGKRWGLLVAGVRWRAWSTLSMLVVAVVAVALSAFGPLYLQSADQSILDGTLDGAPAANIGLTLNPSGTTASHVALASTIAHVPRPADGGAWFGPGLATASAGVSTSANGQPYRATLVARTGVCHHVVIVAGTCPTGPATVMMSTRSAHELGVALGRNLSVSFSHAAPGVPLTVVGLYTAGNAAAAYWWGDNYFPFGSGTPQMPMLDDLFSTASTLARADPSSTITTMVQLPFLPGSLSVGEVGDFEMALTRFSVTSREHRGVTVSSQIGQRLDQAASTEHTTRTVVWVIELQLVLLALFTLYFASARTASERESDVQLAELRGYRPRSMLAVAMAEPMAVVVVAVPLGLVAAWVVASLSASHFFLPGIGLSMTTPAVVAALATAAVAGVAMVFGARRLVSAAESGQGIEARSAGERSSIGRVVVDVAIIAVALAAFIELAVVGVSGTASSSENPLAAFAPGLLALAVGVFGARLLPAALGASLPLTENSRFVATSLATRRVARRPEFSSQVILIIVAVALTTFGISGWAVAARNRTVRNGFAVGAPTVLTVSVRPGVDFLPAVRRADGGGHSAMAVVVEHASDGTTLAVDASRLAGVASWPPDLGDRTASQAAAALVPPHLAPTVPVAGSQLAVTAAAEVGAQPAPQLSADLFDNGYQTPEHVSLGPLLPGRHTYTGSLAGLCPSGCRLVDFALSWAAPLSGGVPSGSVHLLLFSITTRTAHGGPVVVDAGLTDARRWTAPQGGATLASTDGGLRADVTLSPYQSITIAPADTPAQVPAVVTAATAPAAGVSGGLSVVGLDGGTLNGRPVGQVAALPRVGASATLVDLGIADRLLSGPVTDATFEVWLGSAAPASFDRRLAGQGITVVGVDSTTGAGSTLSKTGIGLAYTLFLLAAAAAAVLAVGITAFALAVSSRRRGPELAALGAVGVSSVARRRSIEIEQDLTVGVGVVLGSVVGLAATALALPSLPEFIALGPGPPLELGLPVGPLVVTLVVLIVTLGITVVIGARSVVRSATVDRLRGGR